MRFLYGLTFARFTILLILFPVASAQLQAQCSSVTPTFTLDLTGSPNASSVTPSSSRNGTCCGGSIPCTKIVVLLHPQAMALKLTPTGADPGGALSYEFNCNGQQIPGGTPICLSGTGPQTLTICKVGNNPNSYSAESVPQPAAPDSVFVRNGCTQTLSTTGFSASTIQWTAINAGTNTALYNSYLNCTSGCPTVVVSPSGTVPVLYVDYEVSGFGQAPCGTNFYRDTARVFFYNNLAAPLSPTTICFGNVSAVLSPTPSGGKPPYTYTWSTGSNNSSITVGAGNYTLTLSDNTGCPPITSTVAVSHFTLPIQALIGQDRTVCKSSPNVVLNGTIVSASGGTWSASSGTFLPNSAALNATYVPSATGINAGSVHIILGTTGNSGCQPDEDTVLVTFQNQPTINAGPNLTVCANNSISTHTASITGFAADPVWSSVSGTLSSPNTLITNFAPSAAQISAGSASIIVTTTNNGACPGHSDTAVVFITPAPVVNAGANQLICSTSSAALSGSVSPAPFTGSWSTTGDGNFANASSLVTNYSPGAGDISTGTVALVLTSGNNGNCLVVRDTMLLNISQMSTITAISPSQICTTSPSTALSGTIVGSSTSGSWTTAGSGTISNINALNTSYFLSSADQSSGSIIFTLTTTNNGPCPAPSETISASIAQMATVSAGANQVICASQQTVLLPAGQPTILGSTSGLWSSSGSGMLSLATNYTASIYSLSNADIQNAAVIFTLTSTDNGVCPAVSDTVMLRVIRTATVFAGANQPVCSAGGTIALSGTVTGGTGSTGMWTSGGTGAFNPGAGSLSSQYSLTSADILNGSVIFTLTSTANGPCAAQSDTTMITVVRIATVNAGANQVICSSQSPFLPPAGQPTITGSTSTGIWTTSGTGTLSAANNYTGSTYSISGSDIQNSTVIFTLTSTNNGVCPAQADTVMLRIIKSPTVSAGVNQPVCSSGGTVALSGSVSGGVNNTGSWSASGPGSFNPGASSLNTQYSLTPSDILNGSVIFTLSSANNGPCAAQTDTVRISVIRFATVSAGSNQNICSTQPTISLNGSVNSTSSTGVWSSSGNGVLQPANSPVSIYSVSPADISTGILTFTLLSTNNGPCFAGSNTMQVVISPQASVNAVPSQSLCSVTGSAALGGTVNGGNGSVAWSSAGTGSFQPNNNLLSSIYYFSAADVNNGSVVLTLSSTNNSPCAVATASTQLFLQTPAIASTGTYAPMCSAEGILGLNGVVNGGQQSGIWTTSGSGSFVPSATALNGAYIPSTFDAVNGGVTFTLTTTNNAACPEGSAFTTVAITQQATVNVAPTLSVCSNQLNIPISGTVSGNTAGTTWFSTGTGSVTSSSALLTSYNLSQDDIDKGKILLYLVAQANGPCPAASDTTQLSITLRPVISLTSDTTICAKQSPLQLSTIIDNGSGSVLWVSSGNGSFVPNAFAPNPLYQLGSNDLLAGNVNLSVNSVNNGACGNVSSTMKVQIQPSPRADFSASSYTITIPSDPIIFTNTSEGALINIWEISNGITATTKNLTHGFSEVGYYDITLITENQFACTDTVTKTVTVISSVKAPTAFSPNGDRLNDEFRIYTDGVTEFDMMIFNRWGEMIFRSDDLKKGWDGSFNGKTCQQDAYVWKARITFFDGRIYEGSGSITLLK